MNIILIITILCFQWIHWIKITFFFILNKGNNPYRHFLEELTTNSFKFFKLTIINILTNNILLFLFNVIVIETKHWNNANICTLYTYLYNKLAFRLICIIAEKWPLPYAIVVKAKTRRLKFQCFVISDLYISVDHS